MNPELAVPTRMQNVLASDKKSEELIISVVEELASKKKHETSSSPRFNVKSTLRKSEILLVEDSPIMRNFYRKMLESNSFSVCVASEGDSAIDSAASNRPRLVLIDDAGLPREAEKMAKKFRNNQQTRGIPLLLMLPADVFRHQHRKVEPFVDMCIPKTFTSSILMPSLQSLMSS